MKTGGTQVAIPKASNKTGFKPGDIVICTMATSPGYTEGKHYEVYLNDQGWKCLKADDGYEDILSMMVSTFKLKE